VLTFVLCQQLRVYCAFLSTDMNRVHQLYLHRKSLSTKPFNARGKGVNRCEKCRVAVENCLCELTHQVKSNAGFVLLMYDTEVLKPSNTGKLIADVIPDCWAFLWSRTEREKALLALLADPQWQPFVVFPGQYAESSRVCQTVEVNDGKRPLFIMLDGSWREAKKMFTKSEYLHSFPVLSIDPQLFESAEFTSQYHIRKTEKAEQLATAEVAAMVLSLCQEKRNAAILKAWFDTFSYRYQKSVYQTNKGDRTAEQRYLSLLDNSNC